MGLASLYNVPTTDRQRAEWAFAHMAHHRDIIRIIYQVLALALPEYALDPITPDTIGNESGWERLHQTMHTQMDAILGIAPYNLLGLDWSDENTLAAWIQLNADEHRQAADIIGLQ